MPDLILHAGLHKTGTTAIQQYAYANSKRLQAQGMLYPDFWPFQIGREKGQHRFAHAVAGKHSRLSLDDAGKMVAQWCTSAQRYNMRVLLSAEPIYRHTVKVGKMKWHDARRTYLQRLSEILSGFDVEVVLVLRRQDDFVRSLYQEHVKNGLSAGGRMSFPEFRKLSAGRNLRFLDNLHLFQACFSKVSVLIYEDLIKQGLVSSFFQEIGIAATRPRDSLIVRESLSAGETYVKRRMNRYVKSKLQNQLLLKWLRSFRVRRALARYFDGTENVWISPRARKRFLSDYHDENERIRQEFLPDRPRLFPVLGDVAQTRKPNTITRELVDAALQAAIQASPRKLKAIVGADACEALAGTQGIT